MAAETLRIEALAPTDIPTLSLVAVAAYAQAYSDLWADPARLSRRLQRFAPDALQAWSVEPDVRIWTAKEHGAIVGYLGLRIRSPDPIDGDPEAAEVHRVYLLSAATGRGTGRVLLAQAEAEARQQRASALWLKSMAAAPARKAYARFGFHDVGTDALDNDIPERSRMVILRKTLRP